MGSHSKRERMAKRVAQLPKAYFQAIAP